MFEFLGLRQRLLRQLDLFACFTGAGKKINFILVYEVIKNLTCYFIKCASIKQILFKFSGFLDKKPKVSAIFIYLYFSMSE